MKRWDNINWPAMRCRARKIEAELWQWSLGQHDLKETGVEAPVTQADPAAEYALMVWSDDGGPAV